MQSRLPRLHWVRLLMTYLRFSLPMWLLAQMRITVLVHSWVLQALEGESFSDERYILKELAGRNRAQIRPTLLPTTEISNRIKEYMRSRIELNIILYGLSKICPERFNNDKIIVSTNSGSNRVTLSELILFAHKASDSAKSDEACLAAGGNVATMIKRYSEQFAAWRDPLNCGQGKNIDEFLRVLYKDNRGDEAGGYLLEKKGRGETAGFRVFPGQLLLQLVTSLSSSAKAREGGGGKLVLQDIEDHFSVYGVDFTLAAEARPSLIDELQSLGLLAGSPDAGNSVAVTSPF
ncbi:MAG: hypothetical protein AB3N14_03745 [Flavobacteriaceae bacterium]